MAEMVLLEVAVTFALETIRDLVLEEAIFLRGVSGDVKKLQEELRRIQWFLKDSKTPYVDKERIKEWVWQFQNIAYDAEDVIESYALENGSRRQRRERDGLTKSIRRCICLTGPRQSHQVGLQIQELSSRISNLKQDFVTYGVKDIIQHGGPSSSSQTRQKLRRSYSHVLEEDFVGLESEAEILVKHLIEDKHKVVSIFGMGGLGKTTLAQKIYNHKLVKSHFNSSVWICVSQEWNTIDLLQRILNKISPNRKEEISKFYEDELVRELFNTRSNNEKLILILDDIWDPIAWESIKKAIHKDAILLTTRKPQVAEAVGPNGFHHQLRLLNEEECWTLLQKKALINSGETSIGFEDFEALGKQMVKHCEGLPLAVTVLGGILSTKHSREEWENVLQNIKYFLGKGKSTLKQQASVSAALEEILTLSYDDLPHRLKPCFLYMAGFPEDASIDAKKLYHMWMAERLVSMDDKMGDEEILINIAERYLGELVQRCMVQVEADIYPMIIKFKWCRLHDVMRDLCRKKARDENFLECIDVNEQRTNINTRRVVSTINPFHYSSCGMGNNIRSLQLHIHESTKSKFLPLVKNQLEAQLKTCKLLRVLMLERHLEQLNAASHVHETSDSDDSYFRKSVGDLSHLRFLYVSAHSLIDPYSLNKLKNLQSLDISSLPKPLSPVLQDMIKLRYLYLPHGQSSNHDCEEVSKNNLRRLHTLEKLEVLEYFDPKYYDAKDLQKLTNLVQFSADVGYKEFYSCEDILKGLSNLSQLRHIGIGINLKDVVLTTLSQIFESGISNLPGGQSTLSRYLKELHLESLKIVEEVDFMETLEKYSNLQILQLSDCKGVREIIFHSNSFPQLKRLDLFNFPDLEKWRVDEGAMPKLQYLTINLLPELEMIPDGLRYLTSLNDLSVMNMSKEFNDRVQMINELEGADFHKVRHVLCINIY